MDRSLLFGVAVMIICVRDARLLASRPRLSIAYAPIVLGAAVVCGMLAETLSAAEADAWLRDARFWLPAASAHVVLSYWSERLGRRRTIADWITVLPAPVWGVGMIAVGRVVLTDVDGLTGTAVGLAMGVAYVLLVGFLALVGWFGSSPAGALRFAAISHLSALLLIPVAVALERPIEIQTVDWRVTALVAVFVGLLLAVSFVWHRSRSGSSFTAKSR